MRFFRQFNLLYTLKNGANRLYRLATLQVYRLYCKIYRKVDPGGFTNQVMKDISQNVKDTFKEKPTSLKDYVAFSRYYIAKKLIFVVLVLALLIPIVFIKWGYPVLQEHFMTVTMVINSTEMNGYTGKVRLLSTEGGSVIYEGRLENGRVTDTEGKLYDKSGKVVYIGGFKDEKFEGDGTLYYSSGKTEYQGAFSSNAYNGTGTLYNEYGTVTYKGQFASGKYDGTGALYYDNSQLQYEGSFVKGQPDGSGKLYSAEGVIVYEGDFVQGAYEGKGTVYENGKVLYKGELSGSMMNGKGTVYSGDTVIYDGQFVDNHYDGTGKSYDPLTGTLVYDGSWKQSKYSGDGKLFDPTTGKLIYAGAFYDGSYQGEGSLYDPATENPIYEGSFRMGRYDGAGTLYDAATGNVLYKGNFLLGQYNGDGVQYDPTTGAILAQGTFSKGVLLQAASTGDTTGTIDPTTGLPTGDSGTGTAADGSAGSGDSAATGDGTGSGSTSAGGDTSGGTGADTGAGTGSGTDVGTGNGTDTGTGEAAKVYTGPTDSAGSVDYLALAQLTLTEAKKSFTTEPTEWALDAGTALVYEDTLEKIGMTIQSDSKGNYLGVDVWNSASVDGVNAGMTLTEITTKLGTPKATATETMGETRMVSVSQANQSAGRITNLSADSEVTVTSYQVGDQIIRAIFAQGIDQALILEVRRASS